MTEPYRVVRHGPLAAIEIDNPPVNALNNAIRAGLADQVAALDANPDVAGVVIRCAGSTFVVGADIRELQFGVQPPFLSDILLRIESATKPFVAAIKGQALGGGMELAMGCHFRIATADARLGLPEIKLGLIPGAGGTQRLPRMIGAGRALDLLLSGDPLSAKEALSLGLIDAILPGDVNEAAWDFLARAVAERRPLRPAGARAVTDAAALADHRARVASDPYLAYVPAAVAMVDAVEAAATLPLVEGLARERALFTACRESPESGALRHMFLAERDAAKTVDAAGKPLGLRGFLDATRPLAERLAAAAVIAPDRPPISGEDERLRALVAIGREAVAAGVVASHGEVDVVAVHTTGFPRWLGGPMYLAARLADTQTSRTT